MAMAGSKAACHSNGRPLGLPCGFPATAMYVNAAFYVGENAVALFRVPGRITLWHNPYNDLGDWHPKRLINIRSAAAAFFPKRRTHEEIK
ncbi:hypothetical protein [Rhodoferax ferrireducens]|uniref:hypothetical protein n=1 Tax=Rhodoferax ferrireducens TaxID=192843 RepID=UPI003BB59D30